MIMSCKVYIHTVFLVFISTEESAQQEKAWKKAGQKCGLQIWRIVVRGREREIESNTDVTHCMYKCTIRRILPENVIFVATRTGILVR